MKAGALVLALGCTTTKEVPARYNWECEAVSEPSPRLCSVSCRFGKRCHGQEAVVCAWVPAIQGEYCWASEGDLELSRKETPDIGQGRVVVNPNQPL